MIAYILWRARCRSVEARDLLCTASSIHKADAALAGGRSTPTFLYLQWR
jgi:hypothetical protein